MPSMQLAGDLITDNGYTGHHHHAPSNLFLAPYRAYDPNNARWINRDPIKENGGINVYGYVLNSPLVGVDIDGLYPMIIVVDKGFRTAVPLADVVKGALALAIMKPYYNGMIALGIRVGGDLFHHCLAGCEATKGTASPSLVLDLLVFREFTDIIRKNASKCEVAADMRANLFGINSALCGKDCFESCLREFIPANHLKSISAIRKYYGK